MTRIEIIPRQQIHSGLYNKCSSSRSRARATRVAATLMALHIAADGESLTAASMCTAEGLLASVGVGVDAQRRRARESLVAGTADIAVMVLLVRGCGGRREVVVVLPGRGDGRDESRRRVGVGVRVRLLGLDLNSRHLGS